MFNSFKRKRAKKYKKRKSRNRDFELENSNFSFMNNYFQSLFENDSKYTDPFRFDHP